LPPRSHAAALGEQTAITIASGRQTLDGSPFDQLLEPLRGHDAAGDPAFRSTVLGLLGRIDADKTDTFRPDTQRIAVDNHHWPGNQHLRGKQRHQDTHWRCPVGNDAV
jgi:hypothetical protein